MTHSDRVTALLCALAAVLVITGITVMVVTGLHEGTKRQIACSDNGGSWSDGKCLIVDQH